MKLHDFQDKALKKKPTERRHYWFTKVLIYVSELILGKFCFKNKIHTSKDLFKKQMHIMNYS